MMSTTSTIEHLDDVRKIRALMNVSDIRYLYEHFWRKGCPVNTIEIAGLSTLRKTKPTVSTTAPAPGRIRGEGATYSRVLLGTHTVLFYRRPVPPVSPGRLLLGKAGIACAVEHMDRRIGDLFWHAEALDQLGIGHEQRRLGLHVTSRGTLLAAAGLGCPVDRSIALVLVHSPTPPRKATDFCRAAIL